MTELRRWSEEDATAEELTLLSSAREDKPSAASRARIMGALGVGAALTTTTSVAAAGGLSLVAKLSGAVLVLGAGAFGVYHYAGGSPAEPVPVVVAPPPVNEAHASVPAPAPMRAEPAPMESAKPAPKPRTTSSAVAPSASSSSGSLAKELAALERARKALTSESPDKALAELDKYGKRFPKGELAAERTVLQVQALLARGKRAQAVALANQFASDHPDSPYSRRVLALVNGPKPKH